jgi:hypothetical protein
MFGKGAIKPAKNTQPNTFISLILQLHILHDDDAASPSHLTALLN